MTNKITSKYISTTKKRGGKRSGAGRKTEYQEPVQKILVTLPESVIKALDQYGYKYKLSRPKAIANLLKSAHIQQNAEKVLSVLRELKQ